jgi:lipoprotein NlpI
MRHIPWISLVLCGIFSIPLSAHAETVDELLATARAAFTKDQPEEALKSLDKALALDAKNRQALLFRAAVCDRLKRYADGVTDLNKLIEQDPKEVQAYDFRGSLQFKLGRFKESLADFDKTIELKPKDGPGHWRRGITCYYAGAFDEGKKQFEGYEKVDTNDVENAAWHFLCVARKDGVDKARAQLLKIGKDARVPMMDVYALYGGKAKPEDVLAAAQAGKPPAEQLGPRLFYAHLYLGLYYEVTGDKKKAAEHMALAAEKYKIKHYMGDVAQVHLDLLRKDAKPKK